MSWIESEDGPQIRLGPEAFLPFERGLAREWLLANGLGGFASSTVLGANSRRYHGLLVSATRPPVGRIVSVAKLEETVRAPLAESARPRHGGHGFDDDAPADEAIEFELSSNQYPETVHPRGFLRLESFTWGRRARMRYRLRDLWIEKSVFLVPGANTTVVAYEHLDGPECELTLRPLVVHRDYHALSRENSALNPHPEALGGLVTLRPYLGLPAIRMASTHGTFLPWPVWYKAMEYAVEVERGLDFREDAFSPGTFVLRLAAGEACALVLSTEDPFPGGARSDPALAQAFSALTRAGSESGSESAETQVAGEAFQRALLGWAERAWLDEAGRQRRVEGSPARMRDTARRARLERERELGLPASPPAVTGGAGAAVLEAPPMAREQLTTPPPESEERLPEDALRLLARAADTFWVKGDGGPAVLGGYPWNPGSGRDTMIALPGLLLATGRLGLGREVLTAACERLDRGLIPNVYPEVGDEPSYASADASLWMFRAGDAYVRLSGDEDFLRGTLYPAFREILGHHQKGTRFGIRLDEDGLLSSGDVDAALTWMDARAEDWIVTPRRGKPIEVNALWHHALVCQSAFAERLGYGADASYYQALAQRTREAFRAAFWSPALGYFLDAVDDEGPDPSLRPNQVLALSLPTGLVPAVHARSALAVVERALGTPVGLRSLAPDDTRYQGSYVGDRVTRDGARHQGTVHPWLLGPYVTAYLNAHGRSARTRAHARRLLAPLTQHLSDGALGTISELFDGDAPHAPRGCFAQACAVAEVARVWIEEDL
jgi:glycogen debranching enzyme